MTNERIEPWAREEEEERIRGITKRMKERGASDESICDYLCRVADNYLAELDDFKKYK